MLRRGTSRTASSKSTCLQTSRRRYTPIWTEAPAQDRLTASRTEDECKTLWACQTPYIRNVNDAVEAWVQYGNDPVLGTAFGRQQRRNGVASPFSTAEDYAGTNLVRPSNQEHLKESITFWSGYYEKQYASLLRLARRTAANHVGTLHSADQIVDEADNPQTPWAADTMFRELSYLAERALKEKCATLEQFENALRRADGERCAQFYEHFVTQTQTQIPLPSLSVWHYEGERKTAWVTKYQTAQQEVLVFFNDKLSKAIEEKQKSAAAATAPGSKAPSGWQQVAAAVAKSYEKVGAILNERYQRQLKAGLRTEWSKMAEEAKAALVAAEVDTWQRSVVEGDFDAEDTTDTTEDWLAEHERIGQLLKQPIDGVNGLTLGDFWMNTVRFEELATEHVHTDVHAKKVSAAARRRLYDEGATPATIFAGLVDAIRKSSVDLRSATLLPQPNDTWCKVHWAKFGASTITHHTTAAKRQLQYHSYDALRMVSAAANLYFKTKPLSSALDYTSPYMHRKSYLSLCIAYGVEQAFAVQRPTLGSLANLASAEDAIDTVVGRIARNYGAVRRAESAAKQKQAQAKLIPIQSVLVAAFESGAAEEGAAVSVTAAPETAWAFGSKRNVRVEWAHPALQEFKANPGAGAERIVRELALRHKGGFDVALMRRQTTAAQKTAAAEANKASFMDLAKRAADLSTNVPHLQEVAASAEATFSTLASVKARPADAVALKAEEQEATSEWVFATTLGDNIELRSNDTISVFLPFEDALNKAPLPAGEYCLRIRAFDHSDNVDHDATRCVEALSAPFQCFDAIPQLLPQFFEGKTPQEVQAIKKIRGDQLIPLCEFLRDAQLDVPVQLEIAVGQNVSPQGDVYMEVLLQKLRSGEHHNLGFRSGYTTKQLEVEEAVRAHWALSHPGANAEEWAAARRGALQAATDSESDWWHTDDMLTGVPTLQNAALTLRYGDDVCRLLSATSTSTNGQVQATYNGSGTLSSLQVAPLSATDTLDSVLADMKEAANRAQDRLCTLAAAKVSTWERSNQAMILKNLSQCEFGGLYGRTYRYAFEKAAGELESLGSLSEWARTKEVDRFASTTHPEQRKKTFVPQRGSFAQPLDELSPERQSNWGNTV